MLPSGSIPRIELSHGRQAALTWAGRQVLRILGLLLVAGERWMVGLLLLRMLLVLRGRDARKALFRL